MFEVTLDLLLSANGTSDPSDLCGQVGMIICIPTAGAEQCDNASPTSPPPPLGLAAFVDAALEAAATSDGSFPKTLAAEVDRGIRDAVDADPAASDALGMAERAWAQSWTWCQREYVDGAHGPDNEDVTMGCSEIGIRVWKAFAVSDHPAFGDAMATFIAYLKSRPDLNRNQHAADEIIVNVRNCRTFQGDSGNC